MDEKQEISERAAAAVRGGATDFPRIVDSFALANRCVDCPHRDIRRKYWMCMKVYNELLENYSKGEPTAARCARRG